MLLESIATAVGLIFVGVVNLVLFALHQQNKNGAKHADVETLKNLNVPQNSLFRIFQPHLVSLEEAKSKGFGAALSIVQILIGVQPTTNMVLNIWNPAYECYNLFVPNFLNIPELLLPGNDTLRHLVPLAGFVVSRANQCGYCSVHSCSLAIRRGCDASVLQNAMDLVLNEKGGPTALLTTAAERAVARVAHGLGTVPASLTKGDCEALYQHLTTSEVEWIVAVTAMFGAFNKYMEALALPLERDSYTESMHHMDNAFSLSDIISGDCVNEPAKGAELPKPSVDDWTVQVAVLYHGLKPGGALAVDKKLRQGVPSKADECIAYLRQKTGVAFSVLGKLQHSRLCRALTAIVEKNMVSDGISLHTKLLAGIEYCKVLGNDQLRTELEDVVEYLKQSERAHAESEDLASTELALRAAKAMSFTKSQMTKELVDEIEGSNLKPADLVEIVSFLAMTQALHRIEVFFMVAGQSE